MLGSIDDAEDAVQDALARAWQGRNTFQPTVSFRAWLYRIATNVCLDAIERRRRSGGRRIVIGPLPDDEIDFEAIAEDAASPEARYDARESISLAFAMALQLLPPRQRAVLILRDVLSWRAAEVAELLDLSVPAVNSAVHRARTTLSRQYAPAQSRRTEFSPMSTADQRALLDLYLRAWEAADIPGLVALLRDDAVLAMPPEEAYAGRAGIAAFLAEQIFVDGRRSRLMAIQANGGPGFAAYARRGTSGPFAGFAVLLLSLDEGDVARIDAFRDLRLLPWMGLPAELAELAD